MSKIDLTRSAVLVAGGSGALGSRIATALADRGATVAVAGRNLPRLDHVAKQLPGGTAVSIDLADSAAIQRGVAQVVGRLGRLDGLVNAAGVVAFGPLHAMEPEALRRVIITDLVGPLELIQAVLPHLEGGFVANLTGVVAEQPVGNMTAYSAAKAGLSAASIALHRELRRSGVTVIDIRPPHTETGLASRPIAGTAPALPTGLDPDVVARRIVSAIEAGERQVASAAFSEVG